MKKHKSLALVASLTVFVFVLAVAPLSAFAREGEDTSNDTTSNVEQEDNISSGSQTEDEAKEAKREALKRQREEIRERKKQIAEANRERAKTLLEDAKENRSEKSEEDRQKTCEDRKEGMERKLGNLSANAEKYLSRVDTVFGKAQTFKANNSSVTVANYDALVAAAEAAQTKAAASVDALKDLAPTIDCTSNTVSNDVATFKVAAQQARTDLKAYKQSVKSLLKAIKGAVEANETETEGQ